MMHHYELKAYYSPMHNRNEVEVAKETISLSGRDTLAMAKQEMLKRNIDMAPKDLDKIQVINYWTSNHKTMTQLPPHLQKQLNKHKINEAIRLIKIAQQHLIDVVPVEDQEVYAMEQKDMHMVELCIERLEKKVKPTSMETICGPLADAFNVKF